MKKLFYLFLFFLSACAGLEKDAINDFVQSDKVNLHRCEIEGFEYKGIDTDFGPQKTLKVLMIHGVGIHHPGYSRRLQENLANNIGLNVISRLPKNIILQDPKDHKTPIGNLQISFWQNKDASKKMLFYELTWSEITTPQKKIIAFDTTEQYSKFRVPFNNMIKEFLDKTLPDPMYYLTDKNGLILDSSEQSICWMLTTDWKDIPNNQAKVCSLSTYAGIKDFEKQNMAFITHSLGSKILMDALVNTANQISVAQKQISTPFEKDAIKTLQDKEVTIFMLANQLPLLQIGNRLPQVHNQLGAYCTPKGAKHNSRIFKATNIVAFSDPNDILGYALPQEFVDEYIDSRICPRVTNVSVNVAPEISAFGVGIVNPVAAHTDYDNSPKVINLITKGTYGFDADKSLNKQCHFIEMKNDNQM